MKDLIAKLQLDATCAMGAIWMHIDAQAARIAELEAQIAAKAETDKLQKDILNLRCSTGTPEDFQKGFALARDNAAYLAASTALQPPVREVPENTRKAMEQMHHALSVAEGYMDAVCFNTTNPKKRNNYAGGLRIIRDAMSAYEALSLPAAPVQEEGE